MSCLLLIVDLLLFSPRIAAFEAEDFALRFAAFSLLAGEEDYLRAAAVLAGARLESPALSEAERARAYVRLAQAYLKGDDDVAAERYVRRAGDLVFALGDRVLLLQFRAAHAQSQDAKRKFFEAALKYLDILRSVAPGEVPENERIAFTEKAAVCAVLSPAGPQRQRVMGSIMRSELFDRVAPAVAALMTAMAAARFLTQADVAAFEARLAPHQKAVDASGATVMQRAMVEHNMLAASMVFKNIRLDALAGLLGVDVAGAERVAAKMIEECRLAACIDPVDGFLDFAPEQAVRSGAIKVSAGGGAGAGGAAGGDKAPAVGILFPAASRATTDGTVLRLQRWDASLREICLATKVAAEAVLAQQAAAALAQVGAKT